MGLEYISTRGSKEKVTASRAIVAGLAADGGLYVPEMIPKADRPLSELTALPYQALAYEILRLFLTDFSEEELKDCIARAYGERFDTPLIAPLKTVGGFHFLELFHGKTLAFKDMALSLLPHIMKVAAKKQGITQKIVILTATSGDTGKAALEGFADVEGVDIIVFYPSDGVSAVQKLQMVTQEGANTYVVGIKGNFDDAQTGVKTLFSDADMGRRLAGMDCVFSSANSINIGRLAPQIVYYYYAYAQLVRAGQIQCGDKVHFTVPTGNFGNILAGYYAKRMGLPVGRLICASNANRVLYDYFDTGVYDKNRPFFLTASPSMDILVSSNLERYLYDLYQDAEAVRTRMADLKTTGRYAAETGDGTLFGATADENETKAAIRRAFAFGYLIDPHTAVALHAAGCYAKAHPGDKHPNVVVSTASPYKFADAVLSAITGKDRTGGVGGLLSALSEQSQTAIPAQIRGLDKKTIRHPDVCEQNEMGTRVLDFLKKRSN